MSKRAMMSDRTGRAAGVARRYKAGRAMGEALAEARRILDVAEPDRGAAWRITGQGWACDPETRVAIYSVRVALAESLAAFVGADDPGAYLAGVAR